MRIVQFMASAGFGGAEKSFVELANGLSDRHELIALVVRNCNYLHRFGDKVRIVELASNPTSNNPLLLFELFRLLKEIQPDLVHTHAAKASMLVHRVNRFLMLNHLGTKHNDRKGRIFNSLSHVGCVSEKVRDSICSKVGGDLRVIYNGIVEEEVEPKTRHDEFTMLAIGRLDAIKGFGTLISEVAKLDFPYQLNIVGEGPEEANLKSLIAEHELDGRVHMLGFREDIPQLMCDADMTVISSLKEGGPRVLAEALCYAPLLISTKVGLTPEVLPLSFQTTLRTMADDIRAAYINYAELADQFSMLKAKRKGDFVLAGMVERYENYYAEIIS